MQAKFVVAVAIGSFHLVQRHCKRSTHKLSRRPTPSLR